MNTFAHSRINVSLSMRQVFGPGAQDCFPIWFEVETCGAGRSIVMGAIFYYGVKEDSTGENVPRLTNCHVADVETCKI